MTETSEHQPGPSVQDSLPRGVAIIGAGAMGSIFGAGLVQAGFQALFVDASESLVDRLNADGLTISRPEGDLHVAVSASRDPAGREPADLVVIAVKGFHTEDAAILAAPLVDDGTIVLTMQNGWGNGDALIDAYPRSHVVSGISYASGTTTGLGEVFHASPAPTLVGAYSDGSDEAANQVANVLRHAGFPTERVANIRREIWKKLVLNAATLPTAALTGLTAAALSHEPNMHALVDEVAHETVAVARALGHDIDPVERVHSIHRILEVAGDGRSSMLQDLSAGRRTEIDTITGAVLGAAERTGVDVPLNRCLFALIKGHERGRRKTG